MGKLVTVSAKIPEALKKKAEELGVNISEAIREGLNREVEIKVRRRVIEGFEVSEAKRLPKGTVKSIIREIREES